jgi:DNA gyrase subunit A
VKGKPIQGFLNLIPQEEITAIVGCQPQVLGLIRPSRQALGKSSGGKYYITLVTKRGIIKKTGLEEFLNVRRSGLVAVKLKKDDTLRAAAVTPAESEIIIVSRLGQAIRFPEKQARTLARARGGVGGMRLRADDEVVGLGIIKPETRNKRQETRDKKQETRDQKLLVLTENGFGKLIEVKLFRVQRRGGRGIKAAKVTEKTGRLIAAEVVSSETEIFAASAKGQTIRTSLQAVPTLGRAAQGVRIMKVAEGDRLQALTTL